jgi:hypothetical protein
MRLGRVSFERSYIVDLDNEAMVSSAKEAITEDVAHASLCSNIVCKIEQPEEITTAWTPSENDIPDFLKDEIHDGSPAWSPFQHRLTKADS